MRILTLLNGFEMSLFPYMQKAGDRGDISPQFFWIFRKILGWEREINTAPKPLPEVAPS